MVVALQYYPRKDQNDYDGLVATIGAYNFTADGVSTSSLLHNRPIALIGTVGGAPGSALQSHGATRDGAVEVSGPLPCSTSAQHKHPPRMAQLSDMSPCVVNGAGAVSIDADRATVTCSVAGLAAGRYSVFASVDGWGVALGRGVFDVPLRVTAAPVPSDMSLGGGVLTVVGEGFSTDGIAPGTAGFVAPVIQLDGQLCHPLAFNSTYIRCLVPPARRYRFAVQVDVDVVVAQSRHVVPAALTYRRSMTPTLSAVTDVRHHTTSTTTVTTFTVHGEKLLPSGGGGGGVVVRVGGVEGVVNATSATAARLDVQVVGVAAGRHRVWVSVPGMGAAAYAGVPSATEVVVPLTLTSVSPTTSSLRGGRAITISGSGFDGTSANTGDVTVSACGAAAPCRVTRVTGDNVTCVTGALWTMGNRPESLVDLVSGTVPGVEVTVPDPWVDGSVFTQEHMGGRWSKHDDDVVIDAGPQAVAAVSSLRLNPGVGYWVTLEWYRELQLTWTMWGSVDGHRYVYLSVCVEMRCASPVQYVLGTTHGSLCARACGW